MPLTITSSCLLHQTLVSQYMGKTILSNRGAPFEVRRVVVDADGVLLIGGYPVHDSDNRTCAFDEALPEIWPFEVPMSPCS